MDKRVIFAAAGSGKTTYIVDSLSTEKRTLILTYTIGNYTNLEKKIAKKFNGVWPDNVTLFTYFTFLYHFCYKPFLADRIKAKGICYESNPNIYIPQDSIKYYITDNGYFYSNRLALFLENNGVLEEIKSRIEKYFDEIIIDEIQDIAGRDFNFLEKLMDSNLNMLFVGDFFQHTFDTSRDGKVNQTLFNDKLSYERRFEQKGFICDNTTLQGSWRCSQNICAFIRDRLGITITSNRTEDDNTEIKVLNSATDIERVLSDENIIKLHYRNGAKYGFMHKNWGETKGEDHYQDVCVVLNKTTAEAMKKDKLTELAPSTKNKLYVAITRARGNVFFIDE